MASLTQWTWVWVDSGSWWWTGRPGVLQFMGSQRVGHDWLNWTELEVKEEKINLIGSWENMPLFSLLLWFIFGFTIWVYYMNLLYLGLLYIWFTIYLLVASKFQNLLYIWLVFIGYLAFYLWSSFLTHLFPKSHYALVSITSVIFLIGGGRTLKLKGWILNTDWVKSLWLVTFG